MGLERNFFVWHCTPLVAFIGPVSSIAVASRVEELDPVHVDKVPIILSACFLVPPRLSALAAFQINTAAFVDSPAISARLPSAFTLYHSVRSWGRHSCPSTSRHWR